MPQGKNVFGEPLIPCSMEPLTGWYRTGCCDTGPGDAGLHLVCVEVTDEFLEFSVDAGNDLSTPIPEYNFPGLTAGDRWCLCVSRWQEAHVAGVAPRVVLEATHISTLEFVTLEELQEFAVES
ncbi:MAG: DUF2237 domain-containing protein [Planctomycetaceae bacterium]|nr:DUF2237 domain-containing protein [Planctomycetaceae bacterium]